VGWVVVGGLDRCGCVCVPGLAGQGEESAAQLLFKGLPAEFQMWMSHGDKLHNLPEG
jgi:hypothetical protein